jgi:hypothetical protein
MPSHPYPTSPPITDPATVALWRAYERQSRRAHLDYQQHPTAFKHPWPLWVACRICGNRATRSFDCVCTECREDL